MFKGGLFTSTISHCSKACPPKISRWFAEGIAAQIAHPGHLPDDSDVRNVFNAVFQDCCARRVYNKVLQT